MVHHRRQSGRPSHSKQVTYVSLVRDALLFAHHSQTPVTTPSAHGPRPAGRDSCQQPPPRHRGRPPVKSLKSCNLSSCSQAHPMDSKGLCALSVRVCERSKHGHMGGLIEPQHWPQRLPGQYRQVCHPRRAPRLGVNRAHPGQDLPRPPPSAEGLPSETNPTKGGSPRTGRAPGLEGSPRRPSPPNGEVQRG